MKALQLLKSPFTYWGGFQLSAVALPLVILGGVGAYYVNIHFTGTLNLHFLQVPVFEFAQVLQLIYIIALFSVFTAAASYIAKRRLPRLIDLPGCFGAARIPLLITVAFFPVFGIDAESIRAVVAELDVMERVLNKALVNLILFAVCALPFLIYAVYLHYSAFSVNTGLSGAKGIISFTAVFLIIEVIVQFTFSYLFVI